MQSFNEFLEKLDYPGAGKDAPPGVKKEIENFRKKPQEYKKRTPLLYHLLGREEEEADKKLSYKMDAKNAEYTDHSPHPNKRCANCKFLYEQVCTKQLICSQLSETDVKKTGYCKFWAGCENTTE
jgi:hypothetical protein